MTTIKRLRLQRALVLAILLRLLIMPFYFHSDIKITYFKTSFLGKNVVDIYSYLDKNIDNLTIKENFTYFPLTYFLLGGYQILISPFLGEDFNNWLSDASQTASDRVGVYRYLFLLKLPYLAFDLAVAFLLLGFFQDKSDKKKIFTLWLLNPFTIILIYVFSNIDIIVVFFSVVSLLLLRKQKILLAAFFLGIGASFKVFPLLFLPYLLIYGKGTAEKIKIALAGILPFIISIAPFLHSQSFKDAALVSGLTTRIAFPGVQIGFGETLMVCIVSITSLFFWVYTKNSKDIKEYWFHILALLLLLLSTIHYHIQWILWVAPFLALLDVFKESTKKLAIIWMIVAVLIPLLYDDKSMGVSLLSAISPLYNLLPTFFAVIQKIYDPYLLQSALHSTLFSLSLILIWDVYRFRKE